MRNTHIAWMGAWMAAALTVGAGAEAVPGPAAGAAAGKLKADRILFLGNSITLHGPKADIGWTSNCGMAASAPEKDYVHLLLRRFAQAGGGQEPQAMVENIASFERGYDTYDAGKALAKHLAFRADIVILAIGENVPALTTEDARSRFRKATAALLAALKQSGAPALFVRSCFWPDKTKDEILRQVCLEAGGTFVDISRLSADPANFARSERAIAHAGVANHPGDKGMAAIADAIWKAIEGR